MTEQHTSTEHGLSTADLASHVPDQESREPGSPDTEPREDLAVEGHAEDRESDTREDGHDTGDERRITAMEESPIDETRAEPIGGLAGAAAEPAPPLFAEDKVTGYRERWQTVQTGFVDDPHQAVREADELVATVISELAETFAAHKSELEAEWRQGEPATEELRVALRRYRAFFDQLLPR